SVGGDLLGDSGGDDEDALGVAQEDVAGEDGDVAAADGGVAFNGDDAATGAGGVRAAKVERERHLAQDAQVAHRAVADDPHPTPNRATPAAASRTILDRSCASSPPLPPAGRFRIVRRPEPSSGPGTLFPPHHKTKPRRICAREGEVDDRETRTGGRLSHWRP